MISRAISAAMVVLNDIISIEAEFQAAGSFERRRYSDSVAMSRSKKAKASPSRLVHIGIFPSLLLCNDSETEEQHDMSTIAAAPKEATA